MLVWTPMHSPNIFTRPVIEIAVPVLAGRIHFRWRGCCLSIELHAVARLGSRLCGYV